MYRIPVVHALARGSKSAKIPAFAVGAALGSPLSVARRSQRRAGQGTPCKSGGKGAGVRAPQLPHTGGA